MIDADADSDVDVAGPGSTACLSVLIFTQPAALAFLMVYIQNGLVCKNKVEMQVRTLYQMLHKDVKKLEVDK